MAAPTSLRGRFVWHELMTADPDAAARFYPGVTPWKVQAWEHSPTYRLWVANEAPRAGLMRLPDEERRMGTPPFWLTYIWVADVDAAVRQATSLGGRVRTGPKDIPVGRFAIVTDPQGASFGVYRPSQVQAPSAEPGIGDFSWHELATTDYKAAWDFYRALFGWEHASSFEMGPGQVYWMFRYAGSSRPEGGIFTKDGARPSAWLPYVRVADVDRAAASAQRSGAKIVTAPMMVPGGDRIAVCLDPQGVTFAVHAVGTQAETAPPRAARPKAAAKRPKAKKKAARPKAKAKAKRAKPKRKAKRR